MVGSATETAHPAAVELHEKETKRIRMRLRERRACAMTGNVVGGHRNDVGNNPFDSSSEEASTRKPPMVSPQAPRPSNPFDSSSSSSAASSSCASASSDEMIGAPTPRKPTPTTMPSAYNPIDENCYDFNDHQSANSILDDGSQPSRELGTPHEREDPPMDAVEEEEEVDEKPWRRDTSDARRRRQQRSVMFAERAEAQSEPRAVSPEPEAKAKAKRETHQEPPTAKQSPVESQQLDLSLHDLCDEATTEDDLAWRNALQLLSMRPQLAAVPDPDCRMLPLHVCCLANQPPPMWILRALLYAHPDGADSVDVGGRSPLHLQAATCADPDAMQLLVEQHPAGVSREDNRGFTPLHLMLKNDAMQLTLRHVRILLGQTVPMARDAAPRMSQRRGEHLHVTIEELQRLQRSHEAMDRGHEQMFDDHPDDVRLCLIKISQWKRRAKAKEEARKQNLSFEAFEFPEEEKIQRMLNPAAIATPGGNLLPLHLLVRRKGDADSRVLCDALRALIYAYPESLILRDARGRTPLLMALAADRAVPSENAIDLLLGLHTSGFHSDDTRWPNPAMVPAEDSQQLPLHVVAEEAVSNISLLETVHQAYPGAALVQDAKGRVPLHLALANYQKAHVDERILELLYSEHVARARDHHGMTPFDLLMKNRRILLPPTANPRIYQNLFRDSIDKPVNWRESRNLLRRLRRLPPWLRRQACAVDAVRETIIDETATPLRTAGIVLRGCALVASLAFLRWTLDDFVESSVSTSEPTGWLGMVVCGLSAYLLVIQAAQLISAFMLSEVYYMFLSNPWQWINLSASVLPLLTVLSIWNDAEDGDIARLGTASTGLLWASLLGYIVVTWHGMSSFYGITVHLSKSLVWPVITVAIFMTGFAQMFVTAYQTECIDAADGGSTVCGIADAFRLIRDLIGNREGAFLEGETDSTTLIVLMACFAAAFVLVFVSIIAFVVSEATSMDRDQIVLHCFWEPRLSAILSQPHILCCGGQEEDQPTQIIEQPRGLERFDNILRVTWETLVASVRGTDGKREMGWKNKFGWPLLLLAPVLVPIWMLLGLATFGILLPPQLRRCVFEPRRDLRKAPTMRRNFNTNSKAYAAAYPSQARSFDRWGSSDDVMPIAKGHAT